MNLLFYQILVNSKAWSNNVNRSKNSLRFRIQRAAILIVLLFFSAEVSAKRSIRSKTETCAQLYLSRIKGRSKGERLAWAEISSPFHVEWRRQAVPPYC